jgi:hypothetical protein
MITTKDIAWAAGFLEGEGCFRINFKKSSPGYRGPRVTANQVQKEPLERLQKIFGGHINLVKFRTYKNPIWDWQINGANAIGVMLTIFDFMSPKRKARIKEVIAAWKDGRALYGPAKKECAQGHPWIPENILTREYKGKLVRNCRICSDSRSQKYFDKLKEKRLEAKLAGLPQPISISILSK